jgi:putative heme-binding domain-containing protein
VLLLLQAAAPAERNPHTTATDVAQGKKLYLGRCAGCHGPAGDGGKGTNLAVPVLPRAAEDASLYTVIRFGIPDSEMPSHMMSPREVWQVAAYVRTLSDANGGRVTGSAERGRELVRGKGGCLQCHAIAGEGAHLGPALDSIGQRRSAGWLLAKLTNPHEDVAPEYRTVHVTTGDGRKLSGFRLNEDTWSLQVRDLGGRLHSFWKSELRDVKRESATSMPSYAGRLEQRELDDVVAYLTGLRGAQ